VWDPPAPVNARKRVNTLNKRDLTGEYASLAKAHDCVAVSAKTGEGLDALIARLQAAAEAEMPSGGQTVLTRTRHRAELVPARDALQRFVNHDLAPELAAEELRHAARHLGRLNGAIDVEEILGAIFAEFCIGK